MMGIGQRYIGKKFMELLSVVSAMRDAVDK